MISTNLEMEDAVIGAMNRKRSQRPRLNAARQDQHKDAPPGKRVNTAEQVALLKTLLPPPPKAGETSGTANDTDPTSPPLPTGLKPRLHDNRPELVLYISEFFRLVSKKDLEEFDGSTLGELVGAMQFSAFHLDCMATYYKAKVGRYDRKMKEDI